MSLTYRNQSIDLLSKSVEWFLYDRDFLHERVKFYSKNTKMASIDFFMVNLNACLQVETCSK